MATRPFATATRNHFPPTSLPNSIHCPPTRTSGLPPLPFRSIPFHTTQHRNLSIVKFNRFQTSSFPFFPIKKIIPRKRKRTEDPKIRPFPLLRSLAGILARIKTVQRQERKGQQGSDREIGIIRSKGRRKRSEGTRSKISIRELGWRVRRKLDGIGACADHVTLPVGTRG